MRIMSEHLRREWPKRWKKSQGSSSQAGCELLGKILLLKQPLSQRNWSISWTRWLLVLQWRDERTHVIWASQFINVHDQLTIQKQSGQQLISSSVDAGRLCFFVVGF